MKNILKQNVAFKNNMENLMFNRFVYFTVEKKSSIEFID